MMKNTIATMAPASKGLENPRQRYLELPDMTGGVIGQKVESHTLKDLPGGVPVANAYLSEQTLPEVTGPGLGHAVSPVGSTIGEVEVKTPELDHAASPVGAMKGEVEVVIDGHPLQEHHMEEGTMVRDGRLSVTVPPNPGIGEEIFPHIAEVGPDLLPGVLKPVRLPEESYTEATPEHQNEEILLPFLPLVNGILFEGNAELAYSSSEELISFLNGDL